MPVPVYIPVPVYVREKSKTSGIFDSELRFAALEDASEENAMMVDANPDIILEEPSPAIQSQENHLTISNDDVQLMEAEFLDTPYY